MAKHLAQAGFLSECDWVADAKAAEGCGMGTPEFLAGGAGVTPADLREIAA